MAVGDAHPLQHLTGDNLSVQRPCRAAVTLLIAVALGACSGRQSALDPAGEEASQVAQLFWVMTLGGALIWAGVIALALYASRWKPHAVSDKAAGRLILWAGAVFPVTVLTALLTYGLWLMPSLRPFAQQQAASLTIDITGNQFWWHVVYRLPDGSEVVSANELRLPVGQRVEFALRSADMIHSFWIPPLGGKMDMIPGRTNRLSLMANRTGTFRGQCAEFCGTSHAWMALPTVVMPADQFEAWLIARKAPSPGLVADDAGARLFLGQKCGSCHRVQGIAAEGKAGPDLSHVGSRLSLGAGLLENDIENMARFVSHSGFLKPGSQMPFYLTLSETERSDLSRWLKGLQ